MNGINAIKNRLIDRIMVSNNREFLEVVDKLFATSQSDEKLQLSSQQIELLMMSEKDILEGNLISEGKLK